MSSVHLLDGGAEAYPRMLEAIGSARSRVHLEVYTFEREGVGSLFIAALVAAAQRGVSITVEVDGWGSVGNSTALASTLRAAGVQARIHNPLSSFLSRRSWRNHRKLLLVDDTVAFIGGINIGDDYSAAASDNAWADLALELRGEVCAHLASHLGKGSSRIVSGALRLYLSGFGGGWRLRRRYLAALKAARSRVVLAHAYFLPDRGFIRALKRAARRGVEVQLLLPGRSDVPFARAATMRLYTTLLRAGVRIHEWTASTLHAKAAVVDGQRLLVGSFNLDPLSLVNMETLVEVEEPHAVSQAQQWLDRHLRQARTISLADCARSGLQRWLLDVLGLAAARLSERIARFLGLRRLGRR